MMYCIKLSFLLLLGTLIPIQAQIPNFEGDPNFLFVGNSYTRQNRLVDQAFTGILEEMIPDWADNAYVRAVNPGGQTLAAHLENALAESNAAGRNLADYLINDPDAWKWVTLQDQSQVPGFNEWDWEGTAYWRSKQAAIELNEYIAETGGQTVFYMTWGRFDGDRKNPELFPDYTTMQEMLVEGYLGYRDATSTPERPTYIAPVGLVFRNIHDDLVEAGVTPQDDHTLFKGLYSNDGSHPSGNGTYVAALTIFTTMFGMDPKTCDWWPENIDESVARSLQDYVAQTILETYESGFLEYPWEDPWTTLPGSSSGSTTTSSPTAPSSPTAAPLPSESPTLLPTDNPTPEPTIAPSTSPSSSPSTLAPTEMDATPSPTAKPTTESPTTLAPTTLTPNPTLTPVNLPGSIKIRIQYDAFPQDIAWAFLRKMGNGTTQTLFFQDFNTITEPDTLQEMNFTNLPQNDTYSFKIRDESGDGLCCNHGKGYAMILDSNNFGRSTQLYTMRANFETFFEVDLSIGSYGQATIERRSEEYTAGSWPDLETLVWKPVANEPEWPGEFPNETTNSVMVNIDLAVRPEHNSWALERATNDKAELQDDDESNDWNVVAVWNGTRSMEQHLNSTELSSLQRGWYRFTVLDSIGNGLCCVGNSSNARRNGYITLTGTLEATKTAGLIWGSNGDFGEKAVIHFRMGRTGYVSHIRWDNSGARTLEPSEAPSNAPSISAAPTMTPYPTNEFGDRSKLTNTAPPAAQAKNITLPPGGFNITSDTVAPTVTVAPTELIDPESGPQSPGSMLSDAGRKAETTSAVLATGMLVSLLLAAHS